MNRSPIAAALFGAGLVLSLGATPSLAQAPTQTATDARESEAADFVQAVGASDQFEIAAAKLAQERAASDKVKGFAAMMIRDHTSSSNMLKGAAEATGQGLAPPSAVPAVKQSELDKLQTLAKSDFDRAYIAGQVTAHQQALALLQRYARTGNSAPLKAFAARIAPIVQQHLKNAQALAKSMG